MNELEIKENNEPFVYVTKQEDQGQETTNALCEQGQNKADAPRTDEFGAENRQDSEPAEKDLVGALEDNQKNQTGQLLEINAEIKNDELIPLPKRSPQSFKLNLDIITGKNQNFKEFPVQNDKYAYQEHLGAEFEHQSEGNDSPQLGSKIESPIIPEKPFASSGASDTSREEIIQGLSPNVDEKTNSSPKLEHDGRPGEQDVQQNYITSEDKRRGSLDEELAFENKSAREAYQASSGIAKLPQFSNLKGSNLEIPQSTTREQTQDLLISSRTQPEARNFRNLNIKVRMEEQPLEKRLSFQAIFENPPLPMQFTDRSAASLSLRLKEDPSRDLRLELAKTERRYFDDIFKPEPLALVNHTKKTKKKEWLKFSWERISEVFKGKLITVCEEISPFDFSVGKLQNHYFHSALSALAENSQRVLNLFLSHNYCNEGVYAVKLCKDGVWTEEIIDDFVPVTKNEDGPQAAFMRPVSFDGNVRMWPLLLEKAWAKTYCNYEKIESGNVMDCLGNLTGAPCEVIYVNDPDFWNRMVQSFDSSFIMVAQPRLENKSKLDDVSLKTEYCYTIIQVINNDADRCLQIRNPWSDFNCNSPLIKKSENIYNNLTQNIAVSLISNDKSMLLPLEDFKELFDSVVICKICDYYDYTVIPVRHVKNAFSAVKFSITRLTHGFISVNQLDKLYFQNDPNYTYVGMRMILVRWVGNQNYQFVSSNVTEGLKSNTLEVTLEAGRYVLLAFADWQDFVQDLKIAFYTDRFVEPLRMDTSGAWDLFENIVTAEANAGFESRNSEFSAQKRECVNEREELVIESFSNEISAE